MRITTNAGWVFDVRDGGPLCVPLVDLVWSPYWRTNAPVFSGRRCGKKTIAAAFHKEFKEQHQAALDIFYDRPQKFTNA